MAISNIGAIIYTNQNTPVVSVIAQAEQGKAFASQLVAAQIQADKDKVIEETRPAEELAGVNPDAEHEKEQKKEEEELREDHTKAKKEERKADKPTPSTHRLDLKA
jgi:hypothetical protein